MKITFRIDYKTVWGESLHVHLAFLHKNRLTTLHIPLQTTDGVLWQTETDIPLDTTVRADYYYYVQKEEETIRTEWHSIPRQLILNPTATHLFVQDMWRDLPEQAHLYSSAVTEVLQKQQINAFYNWHIFKHTLVLRAQTPVPNEMMLCICGEGQALGNWQPDKARLLTQTAPNEWEVVLNADELLPQAAYKFLLKDKHTLLWESGQNRILPALVFEDNEIKVQGDLRPHFEIKNPLKAAGVVLPVFSLRTKNSWGIGDFGDLSLLTQWAEKTGQKVLQLLPVNDTTLTHSWRDSYPYNAVSVYALHPIYADLNALPVQISVMDRFKRNSLNKLPQIDYEKTLELKLTYLRKAFEKEGKSVLQSTEFKQFLVQQLHWLPSYAMFCVLRDKYGTPDFHNWPQHSRFSYRSVVNFCRENAPDYPAVSFWYYVQFTLHKQLLKAANEARQKGILLKGDIPIGISPFSVEAWAETKLFHLNAQAGAPPDDFSATGQNWGFPTYNWEEMAKDNYRWWRRRFTHMAAYFDAYRIDHVLGFFRIWEIPTHSVEGLLGHFSPALPMDATEVGRFGLTFRTEFLRPRLSEQYIEKVCADLAPLIKRTYLVPAENGFYKLRAEYDTQRKVEQALPNDEHEQTTRIKKALFTLISNVLFVEDPKNPLTFHPRIAALTDGYFAELSPEDQHAYRNLYNDYFYRRHNHFWAEKAMEKLPALTQATRLLACAEDLGMIPACVPDVMRKLQLLSLEIERMPKAVGASFADTTKYPYLSVATPSTHDMSVLRGWWTENKELTQKFWNEVLHKDGPAPAEADGKTCEEILNLHLQSPSMLTLISFQDWTGMDETLRAKNFMAERINVPANPRHYWRYRMHLTIEELLEKDAFNDKLKEMIISSGR